MEHPAIITKIAPQDIEAESFRIIAEELGPHDFAPPIFKVVQRVIHATGDFSFSDTLRFHPDAMELGLKMLRQGRDILTDVTMVASGINKKMLAGLGGSVHCLVADQQVAKTAKRSGKTRSDVAITQGLQEKSIGILAIGNAPTALLAAMEHLRDVAPEERPLIIGVPVGFVNAAESKTVLAASDFPHITSLGRKGGSPVAAAIVNGLLRMATE